MWYAAGFVVGILVATAIFHLVIWIADR